MPNVTDPGPHGDSGPGQHALTVIVGAHGGIGIRVGALLAARGDRVRGVIRQADQKADIARVGMEPVVADLESATVTEFTEIVAGARTVIFTAGAGGGSSRERKDAVDRRGVSLVADASAAAKVGRLLLVSAMRVDLVRDGAEPEGASPTFTDYLRAKLAAEQDLRAHQQPWLILRPGQLTDEPGTGHVTLADAVPRGPVSRDDVAAVLVGLANRIDVVHRMLELGVGDTPIEQAVTSLAPANG
ncbi:MULTISPECIES: NAD(P)H-binding protein [Streptomyces]|uniref:NAD(P)H-binding protein n=1 Tax=Streptomyces TaxID=1883 RepID=UPI001B33EB70|nr:NAD(P)H-binding protein [Streptomyces sp. AgN23]QTI88289.1 NAD(P)H-binding protein [Streptomyces sp. AgN23]